MTSVLSWQNFVSLCPASFCTPLKNFPVILGISRLPTFVFQSPMMQRKSFFFFLVLVLEGIAGLHRTGQLQLLWHQCLGHKLVLLWWWMVCLENKPRSFCNFWDCIQVLYFGLFFSATILSLNFTFQYFCFCISFLFFWIASPFLFILCLFRFLKRYSLRKICSYYIYFLSLACFRISSNYSIWIWIQFEFNSNSQMYETFNN